MTARVSLKRTLLFCVNNLPDVDHFIPLISLSLENKLKVFVVFGAPYDWKNDFRLSIIMRDPDLYIPFVMGGLWKFKYCRELWRFLPFRLLYRFINNYFFVRHFIKINSISAVCVDGGPGVSLDEKKWFSLPLKFQLLYSALKMRVPCYALPHGLNTKSNLVTNTKMSNQLLTGEYLDNFKNRHIFTKYVHNLEKTKEQEESNFKSYNNNAVVWGSMRFSHDWVNKLYKECPLAPVPKSSPSRKRLIFFTPKIVSFVNVESLISLVGALGTVEWLEVLLKVHVRKNTAGEIPKEINEIIDKSAGRIQLTNQDSVSLIRDADYVMDVSSSICLDALILGKPLIYPKFVHENRTIFENYDVVLQAENSAQVIDILQGLRNNSENLWPRKDLDRALSDIVYAGKAPYSVPKFYFDNLFGTTNQLGENQGA